MAMDGLLSDLLSWQAGGSISSILLCQHGMGALPDEIKS
jgi:hypothetical protein